MAVLRGVAGGRDELLEEIESIYRRRYPAFLRIAVAITGDEQLGSDAVQDAFVGVVRSRRGVRARDALEGFVWRAIVNAARDRRTLRTMLRSTQRRSSRASSELTAGPSRLS